MQTTKNFVNGRWQPPLSGDYTDVINPFTTEVIARVPMSNQEDVDQAVAAAKEAFPDWNRLPVQERKAYLEKIANITEDHINEITDTIIAELGSARTFTQASQIERSLEEMRATIQAVDTIDFWQEDDGVILQREGFGVVACITPWNYPFNQIQRKITPALLAGNTVVVKPASITPLTAILYGHIIEKAGLPDGVFNLVLGSGSKVGDYLAGHEDVAVISFTGSTEVGQGLYEKAAPQIKHLVLELGGKSVMLALAGADKEAASKQAADTVLNNQGQTCSALSRLLVPREEYAAYIQVLEDYYTRQVIVGDPDQTETLVGPMASEGQLETVLDYIAIGIDEGARLLLGGKRLDQPGYFVEPTVFVDVDNSMRIAREEIFGPVLVVIPYASLQEAIDIANDSPYGLSGAVYGPNTDEAIRVASQIRTGNVIVNGAAVDPYSPFGGYKLSGLGREKGIHGIEDYLETKAIFK